MANSVHSGAYRSFNYRFSKPIDPPTLTVNTFTLTGPDGTAIAPLSFQTRGGGLLVVVTYPTLGAGSYVAGVVGGGILDRAGNALGTAPVATPFIVRAGDYTTRWVPASGDWSNVSGWEKGQLPAATGMLLLPLSSTVTVTHASGTDMVAGLDLEGGTLDLKGGTLAVQGLIDLFGGTLVLDGDTLQRATVVNDGGAFTVSSGTLDGVTLPGPLKLAGGNLTIKNSQPYTGPTLDIKSGGASGGSYLTFEGDQVFEKVSILPGGAAAVLR